MALNGLKSALFWFLKKIFRKIFWNFSSFLYHNHTQKCLKWAKMAKNEVCFDFWKNFSKKYCEIFFPFLYQNHTQKCLKWARMTSFLNFEQIHPFWTNLIFPSFDPISAQTRLKLPKLALLLILEPKKLHLSTFGFSCPTHTMLPRPQVLAISSSFPVRPWF